jgi:hypothetical protein
MPITIHHQNQAPDPYESVINDLLAKRAQIDQTIALLTELRGGGGSAAPMAQTAENGIIETAGMFLGMSIADATKKLLAMRKQTLGNVEITRELQAGGMALGSKDPVNTVGAVLTRRFNEVGDVVKVGRGIWGLKEWYPGRSFKPASRVSEILADVGKSALDLQGARAISDDEAVAILG